jgi:ApaG protein
MRAATYTAASGAGARAPVNRSQSIPAPALLTLWGMNDDAPYRIEVEVSPRFLDDQSAPEDGRYAFAYTIRIHNRGRLAARLIARHWEITDGNGRVERVDGDGVVGEQPRLRPGEDFRYTSGLMLETEHGTMRGHYDMEADDGTHFVAPVAPFVLTVPRTLH